jgi:CubicO group peptidase (beta-lactamase class C family)
MNPFVATCAYLLLIAAQPAPLDELKGSLQAILDANTRPFRSTNHSQPLLTGISLGISFPSDAMVSVFNHSGPISLASGSRKHEALGEERCLFRQASEGLGETCIQPSDAFAMGSTAKMYTAAAVMRLIEQGKFNLDDVALPLFDTLWTRLNGTSIVNALGPKIKEVTVRHLLGMRSGIPDFDNDRSRQYQLNHPYEDMGPVKSMSFIFPVKDEDWVCDPGTCGAYSSTNYELLGLLLAQQAGKHSWDAYSQDMGLPQFAEMNSTKFALHGPCRRYSKVHAYSNEQTPPIDMYDVSCTNGWTCGNLISNAADAAFFVRALLGEGERVVKSSTQEEMLKTQQLDKVWSIGLPYGLGLMDLGVQAGMEPGRLVGHGGETYGFNAYTAYSKSWDFGISVVANSENTNITTDIFVEAYLEVVRHLKRLAHSTPPLIV